MNHGVAGYQSGCRCRECDDAESKRMWRISCEETRRWRDVNARADDAWYQHLRSGVPDNGRPWSKPEVHFALTSSLPDSRVASMLGRSAQDVRSLRRGH